MGMFEGTEKQARIDLIQLYEDFIKNPEDESMKDRASDFYWKYGGVVVLSELVSNAGSKAMDMHLGEFSVEEAKKILKELKMNKVIIKN